MLAAAPLTSSGPKMWIFWDNFIVNFLQADYGLIPFIYLKKYISILFKNCRLKAKIVSKYNKLTKRFSLKIIINVLIFNRGKVNRLLKRSNSNKKISRVY